MKKKFFLLFAVAFLVRLICINQSLWLDEAITAKVITRFALFDISTLFSPGDFHPPLYYIFMKMWSMIFGTTEIALRMPSVIFSLLTGHAVFLIASRIRNQRLGLWAAALYLFNPLTIYYSQEARMYSLVTFLLTFALFFAMELIAKHDDKKRNGFVKFVRKLLKKEESLKTLNETSLIVLLNLFLVLAMWTFYGSVFFIVGILLLFIIKKKYKYLGISLATLAVSLLALYPLLHTQFTASRAMLGEVKNWGLVLGGATLKNLLLIPIKFSVGRISFYPKLLYYIIAGVWTLFVFSYLLLGAFKQRLLGVVFFLPILLGLIFSIFSPLLQYFRFIYLIPVMSILIAEGVEQYLSLKKKEGFYHVLLRMASQKKKGIMRTIRENAIFEILITGFLFLSLSTLLVSQFHREDWKSLAAALPQNKPIYVILPASDPLTYYKRTNLKELRMVGLEPFFEKDIYVVPYATQIYGFEYETILNGKGCYLKEKKIFHEVLFEKWACGFVSHLTSPSRYTL